MFRFVSSRGGHTENYRDNSVGCRSGLWARLSAEPVPLLLPLALGLILRLACDYPSSAVVIAARISGSGPSGAAMLALGHRHESILIFGLAYVDHAPLGE